MGVLFTLTDPIRSVTQQALDDLLNELAKDCLLLYPPTKVYCGCSGNVNYGGQPVPLPHMSVCPLCDGTGYKEEQYTEIIKMSVAVDPEKFWKRLPRNIDNPDGHIQTKCFAADVVKIRQARKMQLQPELDPLNRTIYKLVSDPVDVSSIVPNRYFIATWERV